MDEQGSESRVPNLEGLKGVDHPFYPFQNQGFEAHPPKKLTAQRIFRELLRFWGLKHVLCRVFPPAFNVIIVQFGAEKFVLMCFAKCMVALSLVLVRQKIQPGEVRFKNLHDAWGNMIQIKP